MFCSVRGYLPSSPQASDNLMGVDIAQEILRDLSQKRQNLLLELKNYEENMKVGCVRCFVFTFMPFVWGRRKGDRVRLMVHSLN